MKKFKNNEMDIDSVENPFDTGNAIVEKYGWKMEVPPLDNWPADNLKFLPAEEIEEIGKQVINTFRQDLLSCNIGYVFRKKAPKSDSGVVLGQVKAESELQKVLHGLDAVVLIGFDTWKNANPDAKFSLVMHELEHLVHDIETGKINTISHPVEEFPRIIEVFGPRQDSHVVFISAYEKFKNNNK